MKPVGPRRGIAVQPLPSTTAGDARPFGSERQGRGVQGGESDNAVNGAKAAGEVEPRQISLADAQCPWPGVGAMQIVGRGRAR